MINKYAGLANCTLKIHIYWLILLFANCLHFASKKSDKIYNLNQTSFSLKVSACCLSSDCSVAI